MIIQYSILIYFLNRLNETVKYKINEKNDLIENDEKSLSIWFSKYFLVDYKHQQF